MTTYLTPQAKRQRIAQLGDRLGVSETVTYAAKIYAGAATVLSMIPSVLPDTPLEIRVGTPLALVAPALAVGVYQLGQMAVTNVQLALARRASAVPRAPGSPDFLPGLPRPAAPAARRGRVAGRGGS